MRVLRLFNSLEGLWSLNRTIKKPTGSLIGSANGRALFERSTENENFLKYREEGTLTQNGVVSQFYKDYYYLYKEEEISVYFDSKLTALFHKINCSSQGIEASGVYQCSDDRYTMKYEFLSEKKFKATCLVEGSQKNFRIISSFHKALR